MYRCVEERENDFRVAAEIGQMLVHRNQELTEEIEDMKKEWDLKVLQMLPINWFHQC